MINSHINSNALFCNKIGKFYLDGFHFMRKYKLYNNTKEEILHLNLPCGYLLCYTKFDIKCFCFFWLANLEQIFMYLTKKLFAHNDEC